MQQCSNRQDDSAPLKLEKMCVKKEAECNDVSEQPVESTQYNISVKIEPVTAMFTDMVEVTCASKKDIKEEPDVSDGDTDIDDNLFVTNWNSDGHLEVLVVKESCSSPTLDDLISADDVAQICETHKKIIDNESDLSCHMVTHKIEKETFTCKVCELQSSSLSAHLKHRQLHLHEKPFNCEICSKQFNSKYLLSNHERVHTGDKPYSCSFCNKKFSELVNLTRHKRSHLGVRPYSCDTCNKSFTLKHNLTLHIRSHTNEKPFVCEICDRGFQHISDLKRHKISIHTGEKRFACEVCHKKFVRKYQYVNHVKVHNKKF